MYFGILHYFIKNNCIYIKNAIGGLLLSEQTAPNKNALLRTAVTESKKIKAYRKYDMPNSMLKIMFLFFEIKRNSINICF